MTGTLLPARWALYGKEPGQMEDYCLLRQSPGSKLSSSVVDFNPGTPSSAGAGEPSALPWVTAGGLVDGDGVRRLAVTIVEWPEPARVDHFGRRIALTRYYQVDLRQAELAGAGFQTLHRAVAGIALPAGDELHAAVGPTDLEALATSVDRYGFDWLARVAARLLDGPVVVVGARPAGLDERLAMLDAVAALLPYGFRADLVAGTWVPEQGRRKIRLGFGVAVGAPEEVDRGSLPDLATGSGLADLYHTRLADLHRRWGTARVVEGLWQQATPREFRDPTGALDALSSMDLPYVVVADLKAGRVVDAATIARAASVPLGGYDGKTRKAVLRALVRHGADSDLGLVRPYWSDEIRELLVDEAASSGSRPGRPAACAAVSRAAEQLEKFLGALCRRAVLATDPGVTAAAVDALAAQEPPGAGGWPGVWQQMAARASLGLQLLGELVPDRGPAAARWVAWLVGGPQQPVGWMLAVAAATGRGRFTEGHAEELERHGPAAIYAGLALAIQHGRAGYVFEDLWSPLFNAYRSGHRAPIGALLRQMGELPVGMRGGYDLVTVAYGNPLPVAPAAHGGTDRQRYLDGVVRFLKRLSPPELWLGELVGAILKGGLRPLSTGRPTVDLLVDLAGQLPPELRDVLLYRLADAAAAAPEAIKHLPRPVTAELLDRSAALRQNDALDQIAAAAQADADPVVLAEAWVRGAAEGLDSEDLARAAGGWPGGRDCGRVDAFVDGVETLAARRDPALGLDAFADCAGLVLSGQLGSVAEQYRDLLSSRLAVARRRCDRMERLLKSTRPRRFAWSRDGHG